MGEMNPQIGLSMADVFGKLDTRLTIVARVHPDKPLEIPDAPIDIPSFDLLVALDDLGWLYEKVTGNMKAEMPADQAAQMFVKGDGYEMIPMPPMPDPEMAIMQPVLRYDTASKRVLLASSPAFLEECLSGKSKLADADGFKAATVDLPTEGNGLSYVSGDLMKAIRGLYDDLGKSGEPVGAQELAMLSWISMLMPKTDRSQAEVVVNRPDGILASSNSSASMKEGILVGGASFVGALAGISYTRMAAPIPFDDQGFETEQSVEPLKLETIPVPQPVPADQ